MGCLRIQIPYLGPVVGVYSDWTPLDRREPWAFANIIVR
jgi:homospermidine synthase